MDDGKAAIKLMVRKIVFLVNFPVKAEEYEFLGIDLLLESNFRVEVWNLTPLINPEVFEHQGDTSNSRLNPASYLLFHSRKNLLAGISRLDRDVYLFPHFGCTQKTKFVFKAIKKKGLRYGSVFTLLQFDFRGDSPGNSAVKANGLLDRFRRATIKKVCNRLFAVVSKVAAGCRYAVFRSLRDYSVGPADFVLRGGDKSRDFIAFYDLPVGPGTKTILAHNMNYDSYLKQKKSTLAANSNTVVFLDGDVCFHPNYVRSGAASSATADKYFPELCSFFKKIESKWGVKVVIAKHPRGSSEYERKDYFEGRQVLTGRTTELVADARFVILHSSMAMDFAVLFGKPAVFIITDQLRGGVYAETIETQAAYFGKKTVNISDQREVESFLRNERLEIPERIYSDYKDNYIKTPGTPDLPRWQIAIDYLKTL